jgi:Malate:quinone oxidoreductase (Mqo)
MIENRAAGEPDVVLVGAGIMSATLGVFLKELEPALNISMVETLGARELGRLEQRRHRPRSEL